MHRLMRGSGFNKQGQAVEVIGEAGSRVAQMAVLSEACIRY